MSVKGQGVISVTRANNAPVIPPPFATGANNGLSVDTGGFVVLGNDVGDVSQPAKLLSDREIQTDGFGVNFKNLDDITEIDAGQIVLLNALSGNYGLLAAGNAELSTNDGVAQPSLNLVDYTNTINARMIIDAAGLQMQNAAGRRFFTYDNTGFAIAIGDPDFSAFGMTMRIDNTNNAFTVAANSGHIYVDETAQQYIFGYDTGASILSGGAQLFLDSGNLEAALWAGNTYLLIDGNTEKTTLNATNGVEITNSFASGFLIANGVPGFTGTVSPVNSITVDGGIVTAVS